MTPAQRGWIAILLVALGVVANLLRPGRLTVALWIVCWVLAFTLVWTGDRWH